MKNDPIHPNGPGLTGRGLPKLTSIQKALRTLPVLSTILLSASVGVLVAAEKPFFLEDFEDGDAGDGNPVTWVPGPTFAAGSIGAAVDGSYVLTTTGPSSLEVDEPASIVDVSIRVLARGLSAGSGSYISLHAHGQPDGGGYWAVITRLGLHTGYQVGQNPRTVVGTLFNPSFDPVGGDLNIQFDVVGTRSSLTVWRPGSVKPSQPQLTTSAPSLPPGRIGFGTDFRQIAVRSFDAIPIRPTLRRFSFQRQGTNYLRLVVPDGYVLQSSPAVASPQWSDVEGAGSMDVPTSDPARFFQLRSQ